MHLDLDLIQAGGGFRYRPEIPWLQRGSGEMNTNVDGDSDLTPRYFRRNHPDQSMPKIEWAVEREWRKKKLPPHFDTSEDSRKTVLARRNLACEISTNYARVFGNGEYRRQYR